MSPHAERWKLVVCRTSDILERKGKGKSLIEVILSRMGRQENEVVMRFLTIDLTLTPHMLPTHAGTGRRHLYTKDLPEFCEL
ncbi:hypothetical protein CDAR_530741 [Caerostris darwini]|uniref:Uncharacterized protein n=1 Tax=Caerostris darwini TaxID=1538125 RepID=A0AAV4PQL2_9ARAC|nr:hypothetical protein CDAR_530741 [Caerostris darwini]